MMSCTAGAGTRVIAYSCACGSRRAAQQPTAAAGILIRRGCSCKAVAAHLQQLPRPLLVDVGQSLREHGQARHTAYSRNPPVGDPYCSCKLTRPGMAYSRSPYGESLLQL